ncbi:MAG: ROK family transcriptional regulator [Calditrichaeota bacterium]|nr:ROK family transcriptional regulator [Calditrichota bacterium]
MKEKVNIQLIKQLNEKRVLNLIRDHGPISRNELARQSKISKVAISEIVNRLDIAGFILEIGKGKSTRRGGKRPILLKLNPDAGYVIGIEIKQSYANIALADIESEIKARGQIEYEPGIGFDNFLQMTRKKISSVMHRAKVKKDKLVSIGIGVPGVVDYENGQLHAINKFSGWADIPLVKRFYEIYPIPIILENDANTIALGEKLIGAGKGVQNLVCIWIGEGVGAGIIMRDQLIRGESGNTGEIGFLEAESLISCANQEKRLFHGQKFLGDLLAESNLLVELKKATPELAAEIGESKTDDELLQIYLQLAERGNAEVRAVLDEYAEIVAGLCTTLMKTINPSLIVINGFVIEYSSYIMKKIIIKADEHMQDIPFKASTIVSGELKQMAGVKGAIALALQTIFEPPVTRNRNHITLVDTNR